jgi:competence protein ComEC
VSGTIGKVPLLEGRREWGWFLGVTLLLLALHLGWKYRQYRQFVTRPFYYTRGEVLEVRPKRNAAGEYRVLKVRTEEGVTLRTRSYRRGDLSGKRVRLQLFPSERIGFWDYLKGAYIPSRIKGVESAPETIRRDLGEWIASQHADPEAAAFYRAIFLADPLPESLRRKISALGVNHLVALSGFHLGILWGGVFLLLRPVYRFFQKRLFPWRYDLLDLGSFSLLFLAGYLWLTGPPPSLLRSYAMLLCGWGALLLGMEILSFSFLFLVGMVLSVLFPALVVSWGFWLSMGGVFAIFLLLKYWGDLPGWIVALLVIPSGIYLLMYPVSHTLFDVASPWQHLSPVLSLIFIPFYPLMILLHLLGLGGVLDGVLLQLWTLPADSTAERQLPGWILVIYVVMALGATRYRRVFYALFGVSLASMLWVSFA